MITSERDHSVFYHIPEFLKNSSGAKTRNQCSFHEHSFLSFRTIVLDGGAKEDRTPDLLRAKQALSQLSYGPYRITQHTNNWWVWQIRTADLTLIRGAL